MYELPSPALRSIMLSSDVKSDSRFDWQELRRRLDAATSARTSDAASDAEAILQQRAEVLARPAEASGEQGESLDVIPFVVSDEHFALDARVVREVIRDPDVTPVPNTPGFLKGVHNLRGEVLAVIDLRTFLNVPASGEIEEWLIVCGREQNAFGVVADLVSGVRGLRLSDVMTPRSTAMAGEGLVRGVTAEAMVLLDGDALLQDGRLCVSPVEE